MTKPAPRTSSRNQFKWQKHVDAQIASGLSQAAYCREQRISEGSFSAWKQKLSPVKARLAPVSATQKPTVIPVIVKSELMHVDALPLLSESSADEIKLKTTLPNGIALELTVFSANAFARVLSQLGQW